MQWASRMTIIEHFVVAEIEVAGTEFRKRLITEGKLQELVDDHIFVRTKDLFKNIKNYLDRKNFGLRNKKVSKLALKML